MPDLAREASLLGQGDEPSILQLLQCLGRGGAAHTEPTGQFPLGQIEIAVVRTVVATAQLDQGTAGMAVQRLLGVRVEEVLIEPYVLQFDGCTAV